MRKQNVKRVEKIVELNGKFYCEYFGMICERTETANCIHYIEVMNKELEKKIYKLLN